MDEERVTPAESPPTAEGTPPGRPEEVGPPTLEQEFQALAQGAKAESGTSKLIGWLRRPWEQEDREAIWRLLHTLPAPVYWRLAVRLALQRHTRGSVPDPADWVQSRILEKVRDTVGPASDSINGYLAGTMTWQRFLDDVHFRRVKHLKGAPVPERKPRAFAFAACLVIVSLHQLAHDRWPEVLAGILTVHAHEKLVVPSPTYQEILRGLLTVMGSAGAAKTALALLGPVLAESQQRQASLRTQAERTETLQATLGTAVERNRELEAAVRRLEEEAAALRAGLEGARLQADQATERYDLLDRASAVRVEQEREGLVTQVRRNLGQDISEIALALENPDPHAAVEFVQTRLESMRRFLAQLGGQQA